MNALAALLFSLFTASVPGQSVVFDPGTVQIDESVSDVDHIAEWLAGFPEDRGIIVTGYFCDADKLPNSNEDDLLELADLRAIKLRQELVLRGIDATRISTIAYGTLPGTWSCQASARVDGN